MEFGCGEPSCRSSDLALIISRVALPTSNLSTAPSWSDTTLGVDQVVGASTDEIYAATD
jgi:hypothetical protein